MDKKKDQKSIAPAITLMVLAPLLTEVLPGATRFSSMFVFPVEVLVWGGGALLIRTAYRKWNLGWLNLLFMALSLSIAEEFLIQQTSLAPMVFQIKGIAYARAFGMNYVYLLWALIYESVFVVFLPIYLTELIFPKRREELWIGKRGVITVSLLFLVGSFLAWFSWTQIARPKVFHVPAFNPPLVMVLIAVALIGSLVYMALGPSRNKLGWTAVPLNPPQGWMLGLIGGLWAVLLYGIVVLAFGISPTFPPAIAIGAGIVLAALPLYLVPGWTINQNWDRNHVYGLIFGTVMGSMLVGFVGFIGTYNIDLYFKIIVNIIATGLLIMLGVRMKKEVAE
ncbi:MAG TPA: hypothetical protein DCL77_20570 [Prolixibacteraceae bacterium]|jgi:hypothetical protein|nr:hypothetical protein [Prolixibacteraceae bacterium]